MRDDNKTKKQLLQELPALRSQNADLKKSTAENLSTASASDESARYAESILGTVREPLLVLDTDLKIVSANHNFYKTFKVTPDETIGSFIYDLGNKQWDIPKLRELLEDILPEKTAFDNYEVEHDFATIGRRTMLLNARQIEQRMGKERIILLAIEDITERSRLEDLLEDPEQRYRRLFEPADDGILLLEKGEGKITHANQAATKMLGYSQGEYIGSNLGGVGFPPGIGDIQETLQALQNDGVIYYADVEIKTKAGPMIDTDIYLVDRASLIQCNIRDITERKQAEDAALHESEKRYRGLFENNKAIMLLIDPDNGAIVDANDAASTYYGWSIEELKMRRIDEINTLKREEVFAGMQLALSKKRKHFSFRHRRADGTIREWKSTAGQCPRRAKPCFTPLFTTSPSASRQRNNFNSPWKISEKPSAQPFRS